MKKTFRVFALVGFAFLAHSEIYASEGGREKGTKIWPLVPHAEVQKHSWTCGVVSGCTLMNSQGVKVTFDELLEKCPKYPIFGNIVIGPDPGSLASHMTEVCKKVGKSEVCYQAVQLEGPDESRLEALKADLLNGPVIPLITTGKEVFFLIGEVIQLHYPIIYGYNYADDLFYIYDTNKQSYTLTSRQMADVLFWNVTNTYVKGFLDQTRTFSGMYVRAKITPVSGPFTVTEEFKAGPQTSGKKGVTGQTQDSKGLSQVDKGEESDDDDDELLKLAKQMSLETVQPDSKTSKSNKKTTYSADDLD